MPNIPVSTDFTLYSDKGLTWISNLSYVHPRDGAGNIVLQESGSTNPTLIIEPVRFNYTTDSVVQAIDTRFRFFEFPVSTLTSSIDFTLDTNLDVDFNFEEQNPVDKSFTVSQIKTDTGDVTQLIRINTSYPSTWFLNQGEGGALANGFRRLPFATDNEFNNFKVTKEMLDYAKSKNKVIKFKIYTQFRSRIPDSSYTYGTLENVPTTTKFGYDIPHVGTNTKFQLKLIRETTSKNWVPDTAQTMPILRTEDTGRVLDEKLLDEISYITATPVTDLTTNLNTEPLRGNWGENDYPSINFEYVIDPNKTKPDYTYSIEVESSSPSWLFANNCIWDVMLDDAPSTTIWNGVSAINSNCELYDQAGNAIGITLVNNNKRIFQKYTTPTKYQPMITSINEVYNKILTPVELNEFNNLIRLNRPRLVQKAKDQKINDTKSNINNSVGSVASIVYSNSIEAIAESSATSITSNNIGISVTNSDAKKEIEYLLVVGQLYDIPNPLETAQIKVNRKMRQPGKIEI